MDPVDAESQKLSQYFNMLHSSINERVRLCVDKNMEEKKNVSKLYGNSSKGYQLWCARMETPLDAEDVLQREEDGNLSGEIELTAEDRKQVDDGRAINIQGLGDRPLRICFSLKTDH